MEVFINLMKKLVFCDCGSKKPLDVCCAPQVRVREIPLLHPKEHKDFLRKLYISSQFQLRYRGLLEFYGDDLIQYKLEKPKCKKRNEFLYIFGNYLTYFLEDVKLASWLDIDETFWKEFLFLYYPTCINPTREEAEVEGFLSELKNFVHWLDKKHRINWFPFVDSFLKQSDSELIHCEQILKELYQQQHKHIYEKNWSPTEDLNKIKDSIKSFQDSLTSVYEVTQMEESLTVLTDVNTNRTYTVTGLINEPIVPNMFIRGIIAKNKNELFWNWLYTFTVFPKRTREYLNHVIL